MKRITGILLLVLLIISSAAPAQNFQDFEKHIWVNGGDTLPYRLLLPLNYNPAQKYPMLLFLHGAGERGKDNALQLVHGAPLFLKDSIRIAFPAIVVFPQCDSGKYWSNVAVKTKNGKREFNFLATGEPTTPLKLVMQLLPKLQKDFNVDKNRVYVGGLSMGGMGTFEIVRRMPRFFAAAFPICGGANVETAGEISKVPFWIFHGEEDDVVPYQLSLNMYRALKKEKADVQLSLYPSANHNSWDEAFKEKELLPWLFSQKR